MSGNESLIRVENLQKHYNKGAIKALDGINTEIKKGEVVVDGRLVYVHWKGRIRLH